MIKAIIFDCFGVLTGDAWKDFVASLPPNQQEKAHDLNHALDSGALSQEVFYDQVYKLTGRSVKEVKHIITAKGYKNESLLAYIAELKPRYKTAILSNISSNWITTDFLTKQEARLFDKIILSIDIGVTKPSEKAFTVAAGMLGVRPEQCIMIDDSEANCYSARNAGMQAVLYKNFSEAKVTIMSILK